MADKQQRYLEHLEIHREARWGGFSCLMMAICYTQLGDYPHARADYRRALRDLLRKPKWWNGVGHPDWFIECYILAGEPKGSTLRLPKS